MVAFRGKETDSVAQDSTIFEMYHQLKINKKFNNKFKYEINYLFMIQYRNNMY